MDVFITLCVLIGIPMYIRVWKATRHFRVDPGDVSKFLGVGQTYTIYSFTGRAHNVSKGSTTYTSGTITNGSGTIGSTVTIHDQFFLTDAQHNEHAFQIDNIDAAIAEGHIVSVAWAIRLHKKSGPYFLVHNHNTGMSYFSRDALYDIAIAHKNRALFNLLFLLLPTVFVAFLVWAWQLRVQHKRFKESGVDPLVGWLNQIASGYPARGELKVDELSKLASLAKEGLLTDAEWTRAKDLFLGKPPDRRAQAIGHLNEIYSLYRDGALSESEFNGKKWEILSRESRAVG